MGTSDLGSVAVVDIIVSERVAVVNAITAKRIRPANGSYSFETVTYSYKSSKIVMKVTYNVIINSWLITIVYIESLRTCACVCV